MKKAGNKKNSMKKAGNKKNSTKKNSMKNKKTGGAKKKVGGKKRKAPDFFAVWNGFLNDITKTKSISRKDAMKIAKKHYAKHKGKMPTKQAMQKAWDELKKSK